MKKALYISIFLMGIVGAQPISAQVKCGETSKVQLKGTLPTVKDVHSDKVDSACGGLSEAFQAAADNVKCVEGQRIVLGSDWEKEVYFYQTTAPTYDYGDGIRRYSVSCGFKGYVSIQCECS